MKEENELSKPLFYFATALSILICLLAVTLAILLGALGFSGFNGGTPITATCSQPYFSKKYNQVTLIIQTSFVSGLVSGVSAVVLTIILLVLAVKLFREQEIIVRGHIKIALYILSSLMILAAIMPAGNFLTFYRELSNCQSATYNSTYIIVIFIIAFLLIASGLTLWFSLLKLYYHQSQNELKYREVNTNQTQQNIESKKNDYYSKQTKQPYVYAGRTTPQEKLANPILQQTNQNLYDPSSKKPMVYTYSKESQQQINERAIIGNVGNTSEASQVMPVLQAKNSRYHYESNPRATPIKDPKQAELVYSRQKRTTPHEYRNEQALLRESKDYLSRNAQRSILTYSNGMEERENKGSQYFKSGGEDPQRRNKQRSPPKRPERQGVLINYIRGKYAG